MRETAEVRDPLYDGPCTNPRCEGGWVRVGEQYVNDHLVEGPFGTVRYSNTYYPCKECRPDTFHRWRLGHLAPGHNAATCGECQEAAPRRGRRRPASVERERRDLE
jgi:hypothetical protein